MPLDNPRFRESYERLFGVDVSIGVSADRFFERLYELFLEDPEVSELFASTDTQRQVQMLMRSLFQLVTLYVLKEPSAELSRLAEIHKVVGVSPVMLDTWMQALLKTVEEFDPEYDELAEVSWCWALTPAMTYMKLMLREDLPARGAEWISLVTPLLHRVGCSTMRTGHLNSRSVSSEKEGSNDSHIGANLGFLH